MDDYPLLDLFFTMLWFFLFIGWISCLITILRDIFRSADLSGGAKAGWTLLVVVVPLIGVLLYLVTRGGGMQSRDLAEAAKSERAFQDYVRSVQAPSVSDELTRLATLRDSGVLTQAEFEAQKAQLLASPKTATT